MAFRALAPPDVVPCGHGVGVAVSDALAVIVTSCSDTNTVVIWGGAAPYPERGRVEAVEGVPLQFKTPDNAPSGWLCFRPWEERTPHRLVVSDAGNDRVVELSLDGAGNVEVGGCSGFRVAGPRGVAASLVWIAVSSVAGSGTTHAVQLFDAHSKHPSHHVFTSCSARPLSFPCGVALAAHCVAVADRRNQRLVLFPLVSHALPVEVPVGFSPVDVALCDNSWLVAGGTGRRVVLVPHGAEVASSDGCIGRGGRHPGCFECPSGLAVRPGVGIVVRDESAGTFVVFWRP